MGDTILPYIYIFIYICSDLASTEYLLFEPYPGSPHNY